MVKFLIIITLLCSCTREKYILFRYIGPSDKPIECLLISKVKTAPGKFCELQRSYDLEVKNYERIEKFILSNDDPKQKVFDTSRTFGSFRVIIDGKESYFVAGRKNCIEYFTHLTQFSKNELDPGLAELIEKTILVRIKGIR